MPQPSPPLGESSSADVAPRSNPLHYLRLARPHQWAKSAFVLVGPLYGMSDHKGTWQELLLPAFVAAGAFALASSACYVVNDIMDADADRAHPRKRNRPIASGAIRPASAWVFAVMLAIAAGLLLLAIPASVRPWVALAVGLYVLNVSAYSWLLKHVVIADVIGLSLGFVLRVLGGCAAAAVEPSTWLLNCTFFLAMFLAFGKRLGERRSLGSGEAAAAARAVQGAYTSDLLRMVVVVTAVATLLSYAGYVQAKENLYWQGFNLLWLTVLPATFGLLRCIVLLERGDFDDPTELALHDRAFQLAAGVFAFLTIWLLVAFRQWGMAADAIP
ncbi:MAG: decaprenyl-phosphate phosphoribosyltransferase [Planctomycetota bacterium]|nr:UbiA prenyltransferase family protein [Phycisphaerales bacterium]GIK19647.1 MAG: decaprenyl-phosphate phosphoribosyltransferase [Planctomycetota bacterium]